MTQPTDQGARRLSTLEDVAETIAPESPERMHTILKALALMDDAQLSTIVRSFPREVWALVTWNISGGRITADQLATSLRMGALLNPECDWPRE